MAGRGVVKGGRMDPTPMKKTPGATAMALGLGTQLLAGFVVFTWLGWWLDRRRGGGSAFTLAGILMAFLYGGYEVWKLVRALNRESDPGPRT